MESEKVKAVKKALQDCASNEIANKLPYIDDHKCKAVAFADILTLIKELEKEKADQLKHFAERLKDEIGDMKQFFRSCLDRDYCGLTEERIDEILKECLCENNQ